MPPFPHTLRRRLPLTYGGIALLAVLALGAVLITTLQRYYTRQEIAYLAANADAVGRIVHDAALVDEPAFLVAQVQIVAFLTQTQVRLLAPDGSVLADSGDPAAQRAVATLSLDVALDQVSQSFRQTVSGDGTPGDTTREYTSLLVIEQGDGVVTSATSVRAAGGSPLPSDALPSFSLVGTPFGTGLGVGSPATTPRSPHVVRRAVVADSGELVATVELSNGPAVGRELLNGVVRGLITAGATAVVLATAAGWWVSRRLTQPLLALTAATDRMQAGDLAVRAPVTRRDEIGRLAHSFNAMANRVETTVDTLRRFVADAAHELHTPLTALRTYLDLAAGADDAAPYVAAAAAQNERLIRLTDDLLDLSRLESQTGPADHAALDLAPLLRACCEPAAARAEQADIAFTLALPDGPLPVLGNADQLARAVGNVLDNAVKFTPPGGAVAVRAAADDAAVVITVADNGIGIAADEIGGVFGRFHRAPNAVPYPGSGLGLAITHAILTLHNGSITATSRPGHTVFTLTLPRHAA